MNERQRKVLEQIIERFTKNKEPVGSKSLDFEVSSATIRNDMAYLEEKGYLKKPHASAGRVPTAQGYRLFVNNFMENKVLVLKNTAPDSKTQTSKFDEVLYKAVAELAEKSKILSFATLPGNRTYYLGLANILREPEFSEDVLKASEVADLLEHSEKFMKFVESLEIGDDLKVFIGVGSVLPISSYISLLCIKYYLNGVEGVIGLLGPTRMNYPQNLLILKKIVEKYGIQKKVISLPAARGFFIK